MSSYILFPTNEYSDSTKTEEQIKQLMMEDFGSSEKNMIYLLTKGKPPQKPYVYKNFTLHLKELLPYVLSLLPNEICQNQIICAQSLLLVLKANSQVVRTQQELSIIFKLCMAILNQWNWAVNEKWVKVLQVLLQVYNNKTSLIQQLQKMIIELGRSNQPIVCKVTAGRLIAIISQYISKKLKPLMVDILKSILNHPQSQARRIWVTQIFPKLLKNIELTIIQLHLQQKLFETVYDKNQDVGICALEIILKHCEYFSYEQRSSRVIKLFIDGMIAKNEKVSTMTTRLMGQVYQKLQDIILKNEEICLKFWQSLIQLSQSKNQIILNNFVYNLPGILILSKPRYNVQPISEVYIELFYENLASKFQLAACFHEMVEIFQTKKVKFREIIYGMFEEVLQDQQECQQGLKVMNIIMQNFDKISKIFIQNVDDKQSLFQETIIKYLLNYLIRIQKLRKSLNIQIFHTMFLKFSNKISSQHIQNKFIPKFYSSLKLNLPFNVLIIKNLLTCLSRQINNTNLVANYISKSLIELGRSTKSFERENSLRFFILAIDYFSMEIFQEFKLSEKIFFFTNDKNFKIRYLLITNLHRIQYYLTKEQKNESRALILKYHNDPEEEIRRYLTNNMVLFEENVQEKKCHENRSIILRDVQKLKLICAIPKRILTRKDFFTYKQLKTITNKQEPPKRKTQLLSEVNSTLPKIIKRGSTDKLKAKLPQNLTNKYQGRRA